MKGNFDGCETAFFFEAREANGNAAFTLIELLAVICAIALLTATLLPALAGTRYREQLAMCTAHCRQWGVAMISYSVDHNSYFPNEPLPATAGGDPWDVADSFISDMAHYGMNSPGTWFCPVRSWAYQNDNSILQAQLGHPINNVTNDVAYLFAYAGTWPNPSFENLAGGNNFGGFPVMSAGYEPWVKRSIGGSVFPSIYLNGVNGAFNPNRNSPYEWLQKTSDPHAAVMPILTDIIVSLPGMHSPSTLNALGLRAVATGQGHPAGPSQFGTIQSDNLTFGDGHVETHGASAIAWRYPANSSMYTAFY